MCHLEGEIEEQHGMNQSILYNHGILEDCFTILSQEIDVKLLVGTHVQYVDNNYGELGFAVHFCPLMGDFRDI